MIIVHVAIISGCLLASNNPSTASGIVGGVHEAMHPPPRVNTIQSPSESTEPKRSRWERFFGWSDAYETEFQPVSLWSRGINKMQWIENSTAWDKDDAFKKIMHITIWGWFLKIFAPTFLLLVVPPVLGGVVAFITPPRGWGCRSVTLILYAVCEVGVTVIALVKNAVDDGKEEPWRWWSSGEGWRKDVKVNFRWLLTGKSFWLISGLWWFGSLVSAIARTTMQITGVYRNCICYAGADSWWDIDRVDPSIQLANDTQDKRDASTVWIPAGIAATGFMALNCYAGWWYQKLIRKRFTDAVKAMHDHQSTADNAQHGTKGTAGQVNNNDAGAGAGAGAPPALSVTASPEASGRVYSLR